MEEAPWKAALKSMMNLHFILYLSSVIVVGIGAGNVFAFLFWSLQVRCSLFTLLYRRLMHILDSRKSLLSKIIVFLSAQPGVRP